MTFITKHRSSTNGFDAILRDGTLILRDENINERIYPGDVLVYKNFLHERAREWRVIKMKLVVSLTLSEDGDVFHDTIVYMALDFYPMVMER